MVARKAHQRRARPREGNASRAPASAARHSPVRSPGTASFPRGPRAPIRGKPPPHRAPRRVGKRHQAGLGKPRLQRQVARPLERHIQAASPARALNAEFATRLETGLSQPASRLSFSEYAHCCGYRGDSSTPEPSGTAAGARNPSAPPSPSASPAFDPRRGTIDAKPK